MFSAKKKELNEIATLLHNLKKKNRKIKNKERKSTLKR